MATNPTSTTASATASTAKPNILQTIITHKTLEVAEDKLALPLQSFIADVVVSKGKKQQIRRNMECRRKLEEKWEEKKLQRETCEYEFEYLH